MAGDVIDECNLIHNKILYILFKLYGESFNIRYPRLGVFDINRLRSGVSLLKYISPTQSVRQRIAIPEIDNTVYPIVP